VGQPKTTIELNGKLYDASTGTMIGDQTHQKAAPSSPSSNSGGVVDGFFRAPTPKTPAKTHQSAHNPVRTPVHVSHDTPHPAGRKPEHAKTLMRHTVKKPHHTPPVVLPAKPEPPKATQHLDRANERQQRATQIAKSSSVSRFSFAKSSPVSPKLTNLPVQPHPKHTVGAAPAEAPPMKHHQAASHAAGAGSFSKALENAQSHRQEPLKTQKLRHRTAKKLGVSTRLVSITSVALVVVLLTGFVAYQNVPNISMRLASANAGFHAGLPGYTPGGFGLNGPIKSSPGVVTVSFHSRTDDRSYSVTQKPSGWTSETLRSNFFSSTDTPVAFQDKGKTVYIYGNGSSAAWVNGGTLYQVSGNANLNSDQVLSIADSL
jgi:hypothetical protein